MANFSISINVPASSIYINSGEPVDQGRAINIFEASGTEQFTYKMRGVDDGAVAPGYVYWKADFPDFDATQASSASPPVIGSIIPNSVFEVTKWRVV